MKFNVSKIIIILNYSYLQYILYITALHPKCKQGVFFKHTDRNITVVLNMIDFMENIYSKIDSENAQ